MRSGWVSFDTSFTQAATSLFIEAREVTSWAAVAMSSPSETSLLIAKG
jgi:hypothetical protein